MKNYRLPPVKLTDEELKKFRKLIIDENEQMHILVKKWILGYGQ